MATAVLPTSRQSPEPPVRRRWVPLVIAAVLTVCFLVGIRAAWFFTIDDAFITFRYSAHLAGGHGPVWNVSGDPVEGFTNFAWMVWHAPAFWLGIEAATLAKLTSIAFGLATLALLFFAVRRTFGTVAALVAAGAYVLYLPTYFHITAGLETAAFAAILLRAAMLGVRVLRGEPVRLWEPPLVLLLAGLIRPEGVLAALPMLGCWLWHSRDRRAAWMWTGVALLAGAGYFAWRFAFYGQLLPNTFAVKFGDVNAGYRWIGETALLLAPLLALTAGLLVRRSTRGIGALLCGMVAATYATYAVSGPSMDYLERFAYHCFPVLCFGAGVAVAGVGRRWLAASVSTLTVAWVAVAGVQPVELPVIVNYGPDLHRAHVAIGRGLADAEVPAEFRTLAVSDAGAIPFYSDWQTIDYIGLNNEAIAHGADRTSAVVAARPTVVVVTGRKPAPPPVAYGLRVRPAVAGYELVAPVQMREGYWQLVYVLPEWADEVGAAVDARVAEAARAYADEPYEDTVDRWLDRLRRETFGG